MNYNGPTSPEGPSMLGQWSPLTAEASHGEGPVALLRSLIDLALRHWRLLILTMALGIASAAVYVQLLPRLYTSTASILLVAKQTGEGVYGRTIQELDLNRTDSEIEVIRSERLMSMVFDGLNLYVPSRPASQPSGSEGAKGGSPAQPLTPNAIVADAAREQEFQKFRGHASVRRIGQSYVIEIAYSSPDPDLAVKVTNAIVSAYLFQSVRFKAQIEKVSSEMLQARLASLDAQSTAAAVAVNAGMLPNLPTPDADARVISAPLKALSPSSPRAKLIVALGGVLGLLVGLGKIAFGVVFDRRIRDARDLVRETAVPCLGVFPKLPWQIGRWPNQGAAALVVDSTQDRFALAIRDLRTSIDAACVSLRVKRSITVAFVAPARHNESSMLCLNLAQMLRHGGQPVALFSTAAAELAGAAPGPDRITSLVDAVVANAEPDRIAFADWDGIAVLAIQSADAKSNLFADFQNRRVRQILDAACLKGGILLDLPPLSASADALALARYADAVVVVASVGLTTINETAETIQRLRRAGSNVIGTVISQVGA